MKGNQSLQRLVLLRLGAHGGAFKYLNLTEQARKNGSRMISKIVFTSILFLSTPSFAQIDPETAISCILGEARGESYAGMLAVAEGIRNRGNLKRVDGCGYVATDKDPIQQARRAWEESKHTNTVNGADHWHAVYVKPYWAKYGIRTAKIGKHIFYKQVVKR